MRSVIDLENKELEITIETGDKLAYGDIYVGPPINKRVKLTDKEVERFKISVPTVTQTGEK